MATVGEHVQKLLRGELSAIETYDQALEKIDEGEGAAHLRGVRDHHKKAVHALEEYARLEGEAPATDSGPWGSFAKFVEGAGKLLGDTNALRALQAGEEHGVNEYQDALESGHLTPVVEQRIRNELLPNQRAHVSLLESLIEKA